MEGIKINVVSFFDGMGCLYIALKELGYEIENYFAYEIDKFAIRQTIHNIPNVKHMGSIEDFDIKDFEGVKIDIVGAGSPCQGFSFAGKQLNFKDPRSKLFFNFVDALNQIKEKSNPDVKFLLENVNMKKEYQKIINDYMGIYPVRINSNLVSAQNRDRLYWSNIRTKKVGLWGDLYTDIPQPKDRKIFLKDILQDESEIDEKYYIKNPKINLKGLDINLKAPTQRSSTGRCLDDKHNYQIIKLDKKGNIKKDQNKAGCLTAGGNSGGNHSDMDIICVSMVGRKVDENGVRKDNDKNIKTVQRLEPGDTPNKSNCLTSVQKDNLILQLGRGFNKGGIHAEKSPTLTSNSWEQNNLLLQNYRLRRLTPTECARLQTIPEWCKWVISETQQYKICGNSWTIQKIMHIISFWRNN